MSIGFPLPLGDQVFTDQTFQGKKYLTQYPALLAKFAASQNDRQSGYITTERFIPRLRLMTFDAPKHRLWPAGERLYFLKKVTTVDPTLSCFTITVMSYNPDTGALVGMIDAVAAYDGRVSSGSLWQVGVAPVSYTQPENLLDVEEGGYSYSLVETPGTARTALLMGSPHATVEFYDDFERDTASGAGWTIETSGGGAFSQKGSALPTFENVWGVAELEVAANNSYSVMYRPGSVRLHANMTFVTRVYVPILGDGSNRTRFQIGMSASSSTKSSDLFSYAGVGFEYDLASLGANWRWTVNNNSTPTRTSSGVAVATGWNVLRFEFSSTSGQVSFYINGVFIATSVSNVPTANTTAGLMGEAALFRKTLGATARSMVVDSIWRISSQVSR